MVSPTLSADDYPTFESIPHPKAVRDDLARAQRRVQVLRHLLRLALKKRAALERERLQEGQA